MATYRLFASVTPTSNFVAAANFYTLGCEFFPTSVCWLTALWYFRFNSSATAVPPVGVWSVNAGGTTGNLVTSLTFTTSASTGWRSQNLPTPVKLTPGTSYRVGVYYSNLIFAYDGAYWLSGPGASGVTSGPISAPNHTNAVGGRQGPIHFVNTNVGLTFPEADGNQWYGADVSVTDVDPFGQSQSNFNVYI